MFSLVLFFIACGNNEKPAVAVEVPPPPPPVVSVEVEDPVIDETAEKLVPGPDEKEKYNLLKKELRLGEKALNAFLSGNKHKEFIPINTVSAEWLNKITKDILDQPIDRFISSRNLDENNFSKGLNLSALALSYALVDEFGDSKDRVEFGNLENKVRSLINSEAITDSKLIKYKVYEKQLTCSMSPKAGKEVIKVNVDENGIISLNGQRMGKAVEEDGVFYLQIDQDKMMSE